MSVSVSLFFASLIGGSKGGKRFVQVPASQDVWLLCEKFYKAGYISQFSVTDDSYFLLSVRLKYFPSGHPVLQSLEVATKSSQRNYVSYSDIQKLFRTKRRPFLLRTARGYLWDTEVRNFRIGGELVCFV